MVGGAGTWGRFYLRAYAEHPDCEIVALVDRARDRRSVFAERFGIEQVFDSVEELLVRDTPDIVSAILPVAYAYDAVVACAEAGVRVVSCEKPLAAELSKADELVRICREHGTAFGCSAGRWNPPYSEQAIGWVADGHIGKLTGAAIPGGLPVEVCGGGCHPLTLMRFLTGMDVTWVEAWTSPPLPGYTASEARDETEADCPAWGRLGLSGGIVCEVPAPQPDRRAHCMAAVSGEQGRVWLSYPHPVFVQGQGARAGPVFPAFLERKPPKSMFVSVIEQLMRAFDTGMEAECSGHDLRQALEIAIAMKLSAHNGHRRIELPLQDRSLKLFPHPYRMYGGDEAGWESIGYRGPPEIPQEDARR